MSGDEYHNGILEVNLSDWSWETEENKGKTKPSLHAEQYDELIDKLVNLKGFKTNPRAVFNSIVMDYIDRGE